MTDTEKITYVKVFADDDTLSDSLVSAYLADAKSAILRRRYPFGIPYDADVEPIYEMLQVKLAARYIFRIGSEGETEHREDSVQRIYGSANDEDLLMEITPYAKLM